MVAMRSSISTPTFPNFLPTAVHWERLRKTRQPWKEQLGITARTRMIQQRKLSISRSRAAPTRTGLGPNRSERSSHSREMISSGLLPRRSAEPEKSVGSGSNRRQFEIVKAQRAIMPSPGTPHQHFPSLDSANNPACYPRARTTQGGNHES